MSFTNFYIDGSGSNLNAGSVINSAAGYTSGSGNWSTVTNVFTPTDGQTTSTKVSVGDWVSLYLNAASITTFIAQVTVVAAGVNGAITVSATAKWGTAPTTGSGTVTCKRGGSWATPLILGGTGLSTGSTAVPSSFKINIANATYSSLAAITVNAKGTSAGLILWIDGYNTTPGDLDNDLTNALAKPVWSFASTNQLTFGGINTTVSNISFVGTVNGIFLAASGQNQQFVRCRAENTNSGNQASAVNLAANAQFAYCWFKSPTTNTTNGVARTNSNGMFIGCVAEAGGFAGWNMITACTLVQCIGLNNTGSGVNISGTNTTGQFIQCTFIGSTSDGIKHSAAQGSALSEVIVACLFTSITGWGYDYNASDAPKAYGAFYCNDFYSCSSGDITGVGDAISWFQQDETVNPVISSTNVNLNPQGKAVGNGFPKTYENNVTINVPPIGAAGLTTVFPGNIGGVFGA